MFTSAAKVVSALLVVAAFSQDAVASSHLSRHGQHGHARAGLMSKKARHEMKLRRAADDDPQSSLQLDPSLIGPNLAKTGQEVPTVGQVDSLTSTNNFINFCLTQNVPLTNGTQLSTGSCNPVPIGRIISTDKMPSSRFTYPPNGGTIQSDTTFTLKMTISNLDAGFFTNPATTYYANPQVVNDQGVAQGHSHAVIESIPSWSNPDLSDPRKFTFFKGLNDQADENGQLTAEVTGGLPAGVYKLTSINAASTHQPLLVSVAQHGAIDDCSFFEVTDDGQPSADSPNTQSDDDKVAAAASVSASASTSATNSAATNTATGKATKDAAKANVANAASTTVATASSVATTATSSTSPSDAKKNGKAQAVVVNDSVSSSAGNKKGAATTATASSSSTTKAATTSAAASGKQGKSS